MRLHELAKKLGVGSKEIMEACRKEGYEVKSHFITASPEIVFAMNKFFGSKTAARVEVDSTQPGKSRKKVVRKSKKKTAIAKSKDKKAKPAVKKAVKSKEQVPVVRKETEDAENKSEAVPLSIDHHAHKHKRANFKSKSHQPLIQAEVALGERYESLAYGRRRSGGGRRRGRRKRPNTAQIALRAQQAAALQENLGPSKTSLRKKSTTPEDAIELTPPVTLRELSSSLGIKLEIIIKFLLGNGVLAGINDSIADDVVEFVAAEYDKRVIFVRGADLEKELEESFAVDKDVSKLKQRPPVIAFLGHVDHGKTSLLDYIRKSSVASSESGGITQHIGAYQMKYKDSTLCFLDTPGHEAFSSMRARGANLTDIVVLVCAADDGVMPQTKEAYAHAKAAGVPVVVAINKCDLPNANPQKAKQELSGIDDTLLTEEWGGKVGMIECSAETGQGIDELLERIELESEMLELKCDYDCPAEGHVLEAQITPDRGVVVNLLIREGQLHRGDLVLCGSSYGKVKLMVDAQGKVIKKAGPATPVSVSGLSGLPEAGDRFFCMQDLQKVRDIATKRSQQARSERLSIKRHISLENLTEYLKDSAINELKVVLKADVMGTLEVLRKTLNELSTNEVKINIIHSGVGGVNQADIILADASDAIVVGFHVASDTITQQHAIDRKVEVKIYHVIYHMVEALKAALSGLLPPERREIVQGHVEIKQVFKVSRLGNIAGCMVKDGIIARNSNIRLFRDNVMIYEGKLSTLQRFKDTVKEVREGFECGLKIANYNDIKVGDVLESYETEEIARSL